MEFKDIVTLTENEKEFLRKLHNFLDDKEEVITGNALIIANSIKRMCLLESVDPTNYGDKIQDALLDAVCQIVMSTIDIVNYGLSEDERVKLNELIHFQLSQTNGILEKAEMLKKSKSEIENGDHVYTNIVQ